MLKKFLLASDLLSESRIFMKSSIQSFSFFLLLDISFFLLLDISFVHIFSYIIIDIRVKYEIKERSIAWSCPYTSERSEN